MGLGTVTVLLSAAIGLAVAAFGVRMLVTGRAPAATARAFRDVRDAGRYHLLFGGALLVLAIGTGLRGVAAGVGAILAVAMVIVAVVRHRPRGTANHD